jgi:putative SOS response-associated peptidase YedK
MCGRIRQNRGFKEWKDRFEVEDFSERAPLFPRFNLAPSQTVHAIRLSDDGKREICELVWGFVPSWAAELGKMPAPINARSDGVATKPTFRHAFKRRRCIIPVDGFYEWHREGSKKQPYHFATTAGLCPVAAVWDRWERDGKTIESFAVVTTEANALMAKIHDRMPVILDDSNVGTWLSGDPKDAAKLMKPFDVERSAMYPVSTYVNNARNEGVNCIEEIAL